MPLCGVRSIRPYGIGPKTRQRCQKLAGNDSHAYTQYYVAFSYKAKIGLVLHSHTSVVREIFARCVGPCFTTCM